VTRVVVTPQAREDLADIWLYVAAHDLAAADRTLDAFDRVCARLARNPKMGPARPDIGPQARSLLLGRYLILYRIVEGGIDVVRVVHGARFLADLL